MPRFASSLVARFPDTMAVLFCLFLITLGMGYNIATSGVLPLIIGLLYDAVSYLYWDVYWELCHQFSNNFEGVPLYARFLASFIGMYINFALYVYLKYAYWLGPHPEADQVYLHEPTEKRQLPKTKISVTPAVAPVTPPPPLLAPPSYPPPFESPFKHFRGTGESFAHADRNDPTQYPVFQLSPFWENARRQERERIFATEQPSPAYRHTEDENIAAAATIPEQEETQHTTKSTMVTTKDHVADRPAYKAVETPAHKVVELTAIHVVAPTPPPVTVIPSAADLLAASLKALQRVEDKKHLIIAAMQLLRTTFGSETGWEAAVAQIRGFMEEAYNHLLPFLPGGLFGLDQNFLIWKDAIVDFWCEFQPFGREIQEAEDPSLRNFLQQYRTAAIWLGLGHQLGDFIIVTKPDPAPVEMPLQHQQTPQVVQMPLWSAPQPIVTPAISIPTTTEYALAPANPTALQPQQTPSTSAPIQQQPPQQPRVTQGATGLLDFSNNAWLEKPDGELRRLKWDSFDWPNEEPASWKVWSYDILELTQLPVDHPEFITASYVKTELENMAPNFKHAAVVLRIQGRGCQWPDEDDLILPPLLGRIVNFLSKAAEMTKKCKEIADWDSRDEWYQACWYFHQNVIGRENIWQWLGHRYNKRQANKLPPLKELWEEMTNTWLPDVEEH